MLKRVRVSGSATILLYAAVDGGSCTSRRRARSTSDRVSRSWPDVCAESVVEKLLECGGSAVLARSVGSRLHPALAPR
jgi:hypothetical protein